MKVWYNGRWHSAEGTNVLAVHLEKSDKQNIAAMNPDCSLYCEYDGKEYGVTAIKTFLKAIKKRLRG